MEKQTKKTACEDSNVNPPFENSELKKCLQEINKKMQKNDCSDKNSNRTKILPD